MSILIWNVGVYKTMTRRRTNQAMFQREKTNLSSIVLMFVQGAILFNNDCVTLVYLVHVVIIHFHRFRV
jgi:hypothetical protein